MAGAKRIMMERNIMDFISAYTERVGCGPTYREIGDAVGLRSTSSVSRHIMYLLADGLLERDEHNRLRLSTVESDGCDGMEEQRLKLLLADGGEMLLDCYIDRDSRTGKSKVRLGGILETKRLNHKVTRIIGCRVESVEEEPRRAGGANR